MARPLRLDYAGGWYHVTARGNERRDIFRDDADREQFVLRLGQMTADFSVRLHGYVLMNNHYHLLLENVEAELSRAVQWLNSGYGMWFNRCHRRTGHLFQGRFKAVVVEWERWGLELSRYVHLNPVRVRGLGFDKAARRRHRQGVGEEVETTELRLRQATLREYRWSSYRAYIGKERRPEWLNCEAVLSQLGKGNRSRRTRYQQYVEEGLQEGGMTAPWENLQGQVVLGGEEFVRDLQGRLEGDEREQGSLRQLQGRPGFAEVMKVVEELKGEKWTEFVDRYGDWGRDVALWLGRRRCRLKLKELGELAGGIDYGTVSAAILQLERRAGEDEKLAKFLSRADRLLNQET